MESSLERARESDPFNLSQIPKDCKTYKDFRKYYPELVLENSSDESDEQAGRYVLTEEDLKQREEQLKKIEAELKKESEEKQDTDDVVRVVRLKRGALRKIDAGVQGITRVTGSGAVFGNKRSWKASSSSSSSRVNNDRMRHSVSVLPTIVALSLIQSCCLSNVRRSSNLRSEFAVLIANARTAFHERGTLYSCPSLFVCIAI